MPIEIDSSFPGGNIVVEGIDGNEVRVHQDLRDTAITRLALASCTAMEIHAITGHDLETIHRVMKHYLARTDALADAAITKLKTWMNDEGIAL